MITHYVPAFAKGLGVRQQAVCGAYVDPAREHNPNPSCPNCLHLLELEARDL